jgi:hypothetical protein
MAPLIIAERRIILFLVSFIAGIVCFHQLDHTALQGTPLWHITGAAFCVTFVLAIIYFWLWVRAHSGPLLGTVIFHSFAGLLAMRLPRFNIACISQRIWTRPFARR